MTVTSSDPRQWPASSVEMVALASLIPYAKNARKHPEAQLKQIVASMQEFGWTIPVLRDEAGGLIAGHARCIAARRLGWKEAPTMTAVGWTEAQKRAYVIADNKLSLGSEWDEDMLVMELGDLSADGFDLSLTGFDEGEVAKLLGNTLGGGNDPDVVPEPQALAISAPGDIWQCGPHRLICGDCTDPEIVSTLLGDAKPHLMVTDPPYGVDYDPNWRNEPEKLNARSPTAFGGPRPKGGRHAAKGRVINDDRSDWTDAWQLFHGDVAYVWHGERQSPEIIQQFRGLSFEPRNLIVWAKDGLVISRGHYHPQHETCWYLVRNGKTGHWAGDRKQSTLWNIPRNRRNESGHGAQKPVECMLRPIHNNSDDGDAVYDPFLGSGTTVIAAHMSGRICLGAEISPIYVDVAVRRWEAFTGGKAVLERNGLSFAEVEQERAAQAETASASSASR